MSDPHAALGVRRRAALAAYAALRLVVLPAFASILLIRAVPRLVVNVIGLVALIISGNHRRDDDEVADQVRSWKQLALAPLWVPVALVMSGYHLWCLTFGGVIWLIGSELAAARRLFSMAARGR